MAKRSISAGKSETLSLRLDPKTRFLLEYLSRLNGQTITTVVERAITAAASTETVAAEGYSRNWQDFWDVNDGIRALKMAEVPDFYPTWEEERRLSFAKNHYPFFFVSLDPREFHQVYLEVLWPRIDEFVEYHESHRKNDWFAAGKLMQGVLREANLSPPNWPLAGEEK